MITCNKAVLKIFALIVFFLFTSCVTKALWSKPYYNETFRQFLISNDGKLIVFLGKNYDYIFSDDSDVIKQILRSNRRDLLFINVKKSNLNLDRYNNIYGEVYIETFDLKLPRRDFAFLEALGFRSTDDQTLSLKLKVVGKRYLPRDDLGQYLPELDRTYVVPIKYKPGSLVNLAKVSLTPLSISADAVIVIGKSVMAPFRGN